MWEDEDEEGLWPNQFGCDDSEFPIESSLDKHAELKRSKGKIIFLPLKYPRAEQERVKGEVVAKLLKRSLNIPGFENDKTETEEQALGFTIVANVREDSAETEEQTFGYTVVAKNQEVLDGWYKTCRRLGKQIWRDEADIGMNRFGYDGASFDVKKFSFDCDELNNYKHLMLFSPLEHASHDL
ncbi:hypothetical protein BDW74DRAFT_113253 [Aspergillus multicolor]|uniref:uncharacterized protein n=1 Tax=Aspergillus multicolor TaxID=41759 RepID=UPI003CCE2901